MPKSVSLNDFRFRETFRETNTVSLTFDPSLKLTHPDHP